MGTFQLHAKIPKKSPTIPIIFIVLLTVLATDVNIGRLNPNTFAPQKLDQRIYPNRLNADLLEKAIIFYSNRARTKYGRAGCRLHEKLRQAARAHSHEMARLNYFAHESPVKKNRLLKNRFTNAGITLTNTMIGENIGVDYFLKIAKIPFHTRIVNGETNYYNAKTGKPIRNQTYREFARSMVDNWMESPHHKENILEKNFTHIGIGVASGTFNSLKALYVTQLFQGPVKT